MPLLGHPTCLWASPRRAHLCLRPGIVSVRWRSATQFKTQLGRRRLERINHDLQTVPNAEKQSASGPDSRRASPLSSEPKNEHASRTRYFSKLIIETISYVLERRFSSADKISRFGIQSRNETKRLEELFTRNVEQMCRKAEDRLLPPPPLFAKLRQAFIKGSIEGLRVAVALAFSNFVLAPKFTDKECKIHAELSDMTYPAEWYPATRALQRKVILHVGPTNSGKTYHALKRLEAAKTGIFAGPLRLLAHEVYTRFNANNVPCALVTGEERRLPPDLDPSKEFPMRSCTVEMVPLNTRVDVAVIDEIQMIGDVERGWAWTQAFLGVQAKELHLCGEARTVPLIEDLCALLGDELEIHHYDRLSPLKAMDHSIDGNLKALRKGDCVISFSRLGIHKLKSDIERTTGKRCAVIYGSLPPETRAAQAALFNDPDNDYDFIAASDAIGMGLNLSIKRIIFEKLWKFDGLEDKMLTVPQLKQIAGRAGRYRTAAQGTKPDASQIDVLDPGSSQPKREPPSIGLVTSFFKQDIPLIQSAILEEPQPLTSAGILPSDAIIARFAAHFPAETPFSYILLHLHELATLHSRFRLCDLKEKTNVADIIQPFNLTIAERIAFINAPVMLRQEGFVSVIQALARCVANQSGGDLIDIAPINLELIDEPENPTDKSYLFRLEFLHNTVNLYLWLSYRFAGIFRSVNLGFHVKGVVEEKINKCLAAVRRRMLTKIERERYNEQKKMLLLGSQEQLNDMGLEVDSCTTLDEKSS